jgi:methionyl-tRNA synthetase
MTGTGNILEPGHELKRASLLFDKIEDEQIEMQIQKLLNTKKSNQVQNQSSEPQKDNISYEEFTKMDIRVGTILEAEKVAKTKKLMKLKIDTGVDIRTVVSGISEFFEPADIIGKQVSILINLEPREIRGIESKGMILMAENPDGKLVFVSPLESSSNGSTIK